jgi:hypothetical protein
MDLRVGIPAEGPVQPPWPLWGRRVGEKMGPWHKRVTAAQMPVVADAEGTSPLGSVAIWAFAGWRDDFPVNA